MSSHFGLCLLPKIIPHWLSLWHIENQWVIQKANWSDIVCTHNTFNIAVKYIWSHFPIDEFTLKINGHVFERPQHMDEHKPSYKSVLCRGLV